MQKFVQLFPHRSLADQFWELQKQKRDLPVNTEISVR